MDVFSQGCSTCFTTKNDVNPLIEYVAARTLIVNIPIERARARDAQTNVRYAWPRHGHQQAFCASKYAFVRTYLHTHTRARVYAKLFLDFSPVGDCVGPRRSWRALLHLEAFNLDFELDNVFKLVKFVELGVVHGSLSTALT